MKVRASKTDLFFDCASSILETKNPHEPVYEVAQLGTAVHESLGARAVGNDVELSEIADRHGVKLEDLVPLHTYGLKVWRELSGHFPEPQVEAPVESDLITGRVDLLGMDSERAAILDWKSGWLRRHKHFQMASYAHGVRAKFGMPKSGKITTVLVWLRFGEYDVAAYDDAKLNQFAETFKAQLMEIGRHYAAGEWCMYCPRRLECETRSAYVRSAAQSLATTQDSREELTPEKLASLWPQSRMLKKAIEAYEVALKEQLSHGALTLSDGTTLTLGEHSRQTIDARRAWPVLTQDCGFTQEDMARVISVSKTEVEKVASEKAPRGAKGKAKVQTVEKLKEAGAVTVSSYRKVEVKQ